MSAGGDRRWRGRFALSEEWALFVGEVGDSHRHAHLAVQAVARVDGDVEVEDRRGARLHAATFIIAPMTPHRLAPTAARVISLFAPVELPFGRRLAGGFSRRSISAAPKLAQFLRKAAHVDAAHGAIGELDDALGLAQAPGVDERLAIAVSAAVEDGLSISAAASRIGLTGAGLRALSHREIGAGPARAVLWRKLVAAMRALSAGASATEAAHAGGFADQSHFNRTMRLTFGLTPGAVAAIIAGD